MDEEEIEYKRRKRLPVICERCEGKAVIALRGHGRVVIYCEKCGARIFAYYTNPDEAEHNTPPPEEDALFIRLVERALLNEVSATAAALYEYLRRYVKAHGYAPTLREMQTALGWRSANTVSHHLNRLADIGLIERDYGEPRGIRLPHIA